MSYKKYWNEEIETLSREKLEELQLKELKEILLLAYEKSSYYKEVFKDSGILPEDLKTLSDIQKFPFTNKRIERERQSAAPIIGDMACVPEKDIVYISASSGTTGVPTVSPFTKQDFDEFQDVQSRLFWAAGMRPDDRYIHALNFTLFVGGPDVIGAQNLGALSIWAGTVPSEKLLYIMKEFQPTITWTTPSYAWHLGESAKKAGIDPAKDLAIRKIIVAGEPGGSIEATREAVEKLWNAELYDFYGISDIFGACAGMCEAKDGLHIAEDHLLVEILDTVTLKPVKDGAKGELVLTTLRKKARPLIRFRTGDIAYINKERCSCGRTHARINITGRVDDMFIISGVNIFPSDIEYVVRNTEGVNGEYRIKLFEENRLAKFVVEVEKIESSKVSSSEIAENISNSIKTRLGVKPKRVDVLAENSLPRETHKAKRIVKLS